MIKIQNLNKYYNNKIIIKNLNINIEKNKITVILGSSGIGKTTLLNLIGGIDSNYEGIIEKKYKKISYIFQEDRLLEWLNVTENINYVCENLDFVKFDLILDVLGLKEFKNSSIKTLSGGQKQRVNIARAFCYDADFILMDEAFKSLDIKTKYEIIINLIKLFELNKKTILMVTHDIREAILLGDVIYIMEEQGNILKKIEINSKKIDRTLQNDEILKYEKLIYKTILK